MVKKAEGWAGYKTQGVSGWHLTGQDEECKVEFDSFTCNHPYHKGDNG